MQEKIFPGKNITHDC